MQFTDTLYCNHSHSILSKVKSHPWVRPEVRQSVLCVCQRSAMCCSVLDVLEPVRSTRRSFCFKLHILTLLSLHPSHLLLMLSDFPAFVLHSPTSACFHQSRMAPHQSRMASHWVEAGGFCGCVEERNEGLHSARAEKKRVRERRTNTKRDPLFL